VPRTATLDAHWEITTSEPFLRWLELDLVPLGRAAVDPARGRWRTDAIEGSHRFEPVLPGEYDLVLVYEDGEDERRELGRRRLTLAPGESAAARLAAQH
jgi:hypothetical protein